MNHFAALLIVAFLKANTDWLGSCGEDGCLYDLQLLLWAIFMVRFLFNIREVAGPLITQRMNDSGSGIMDKDAEKYNLTSEPDDDLQFLEEVDREDYEGTFHDYAEAVIQFGYLNLYSVVMPYLGRYQQMIFLHFFSLLFLINPFLNSFTVMFVISHHLSCCFIGAISLFENLLKTRMDAYKLCSMMRRPHVTIAEDVGGWAALMDMMSILGNHNNSFATPLPP